MKGKRGTGKTGNKEKETPKGQEHSVVISCLVSFASYLKKKINFTSTIETLKPE
jgi:hypothetical protein